MTLRMLDSVEVGNLPPGAGAYAGYVDGRFATWIDLKAAFPHARLLSIAVFPADDADCLDVEAEDATIPEVYDWFIRQQKRGVWRPCIYTSASNLASLLATMEANGFARSSFRVWSAHYLAGEHICAPSSCGFPEADGTQWRDSAPGLNGSRVDESLLHHSFFPAPPKPPPAPIPDPVPAQLGDDDMQLPAGPWKNAAGFYALTLMPPQKVDLPEGAEVSPSVLRLSCASPASFQLALGPGEPANWQEVTVDYRRSPVLINIDDPQSGMPYPVLKIKPTDPAGNPAPVSYDFD